MAGESPYLFTSLFFSIFCVNGFLSSLLLTDILVLIIFGSFNKFISGISDIIDIYF